MADSQSMRLAGQTAGGAAGWPVGAPRRGRHTGLVFLSGGSALHGLAAMLARAGYHATHIVSVFDSGGSAGRLRDVCRGIAIGDIRKRLIAIGDATASQPLIDLFSARLPALEPAPAVRGMLEALAEARSDLLDGVAPHSAAEIAQAVSVLLAAVPQTFDWRDTSIGNLILTGGYLQHNDWEPALAWAHGLVSACGDVVPVSTEQAHLGAQLANGRYVLGQSLLTNEMMPIEAPIESLWLHPDDQSPAETVSISPHSPALQALEQANAIVYSWGSFYTSVLCSLLVGGVGEILRASTAPKVLLLNPFSDAETRGKQPADLVRELFRYAGAKNGHSAEAPVTHVLALRPPAPSQSALYNEHSRADLEALGVEVVEVECAGIPQEADLQRVMERLLALADHTHRMTAR